MEIMVVRHPTFQCSAQFRRMVPCPSPEHRCDESRVAPRGSGIAFGSTDQGLLQPQDAAGSPPQEVDPRDHALTVPRLTAQGTPAASPTLWFVDQSGTRTLAAPLPSTTS
jgi:hypothetical protein